MLLTIYLKYVVASMKYLKEVTNFSLRETYFQIYNSLHLIIS